MKKFTCLDLFCGAGGLSEGFLETNKFDFLGHVEWEKPMVDTLRNNLVKRWKYSEDKAKESVIQFDIQKTDELLFGNWPEETMKDYAKANSDIVAKKGLDGIIGKKTVDVVIGGPPCQAYSLAGRAQDPNSMKNDYRNYLFESFVKIVEHYRPKVFVFENVPGMLSARPGDTLVIERICKAFNEIGYEIRSPQKMKKSIYCASDFEVPQNRNRVIIFGVDKNSEYKTEDFYEALNAQKLTGPKKTVRDAIGAMPKFRELEHPYKKGNANVSHELIGNEVISQHEARYHNKRDIQVFRKWVSQKMNDIPNEEKLEFYKQVSGKTTNHNKYRSLEWDKPSPTIVSHLHKDGLMFIHPDEEQGRSITIREAALLQSFPMDYEFIGSNAYCYKMIGNAVPVLFAKSIAKAVSSVLEVNDR
ncbi:DNA cytosine methyltransferase [Falcatimonas sp. MSJ-15]|uniref:DNA cytosine methyltransferase n=1 Tax=Falcatimonas sp. MSJ-15 TaxID=2841515 RepID=UPI001C11FEA0|nr:DNA cytosine methyltransferase [Falcatimonas sp. MSJ-15]MBU5470565.1 DNA cytosine methyltransferase [Falcatimonas sp. MSJ-15]